MSKDTVLPIDVPLPMIDLRVPFLQFYWRDKPQTVAMVQIGEERYPATINGHALPQPVSA
ncbi:hypothetical protein EOM33_01350 [Candidatus Saccharibacteria bacterium]|nr:hypothetical protein [Candidatus Saccharibacteria bacterium]